MSQHLSSERISTWTAGERTWEEEQHVRECPECAAELAQFEEALSLMRGFVRHWSDQKGGSAPDRGFQVELARNRIHPWHIRWALAAVAVLLLAMVPIVRNARHRQSGGKMAQADAQLLEQVSTEVSRAVPRPMEPLLKLVSWDSSGASESQDETTRKDHDDTTQPK